MEDDEESTHNWLTIDAVTLANTYALLVVFTLLFSTGGADGYVFPLFLYEGMLPPATTPLLVLNFFTGMCLLLPLGTAFTAAMRGRLPGCGCPLIDTDWRAAGLLTLPVVPAVPEYVTSISGGVDASAPGVEAIATAVGVVVHLTGRVVGAPVTVLLDVAGVDIAAGTTAALAVTFGVAFWYVTLVVVEDVVRGNVQPDT